VRYTYLLTPWCRVLFEKLVVTHLVKQYPDFLWNPKVHYCVHTSPPLDPILSQPNPVRPLDPYFPKVHLNVILPPTSRSYQWSLTFGPPKHRKRKLLYSSIWYTVRSNPLQVIDICLPFSMFSCAFLLGAVTVTWPVQLFLSKSPAVLELILIRNTTESRWHRRWSFTPPFRKWQKRGNFCGLSLSPNPTLHLTHHIKISSPKFLYEIQLWNSVTLHQVQLPCTCKYRFWSKFGIFFWTIYEILELRH
jgi:hypothetical protein